MIVADLWSDLAAGMVVALALTLLAVGVCWLIGADDWPWRMS